MKIAIYSTDGNGSKSLYAMDYRFLPDRADEWDMLAQKYPEHEFKIYCTLSGGMLVDAIKDEVRKRAEKVPYIILPDRALIDEIADRIAADEPDVAVAFTQPCIPYDWNILRDSLVGDALKARGIKVIAHAADMANLTYDKSFTNAFLKEHGFNCAQSIYVRMALYRSQKTDRDMNINVYKEYTLKKIKALPYPVVIKTAAGAGSIGLLVAGTYEEAEDILEKYTGESDILVEEWISGENFGIELCGVPGAYRIYPPVMFTVTESGVTNPFVSLKMGPVTNPDFKVGVLYDELRRLAEEFEFSGSAEIDLIFHEGEWYIVEINNRSSYLSPTTAAMAGESMFLSYVKMALGEHDGEIVKEPYYALDFKTPKLSEDVLLKLWEEFEGLKSAMNYTLTISRETQVNFCEFVIGGFKTARELAFAFEKLASRHPELFTEGLTDKVSELSGQIG